MCFHRQNAAIFKCHNHTHYFKLIVSRTVIHFFSTAAVEISRLYRKKLKYISTLTQYITLVKIHQFSLEHIFLHSHAYVNNIKR